MNHFCLLRSKRMPRICAETLKIFFSLRELTHSFIKFLSHRAVYGSDDLVLRLFSQREKE